MLTGGCANRRSNLGHFSPAAPCRPSPITHVPQPVSLTAARSDFGELAPRIRHTSGGTHQGLALLSTSYRQRVSLVSLFQQIPTGRIVPHFGVLLFLPREGKFENSPNSPSFFKNPRNCKQLCAFRQSGHSSGKPIQTHPKLTFHFVACFSSPARSRCTPESPYRAPTRLEKA